MVIHRLEIQVRPQVRDALGAQIRARLQTWLDLPASRVTTRKVFHLDLDIDPTEAAQVLAALVDPVAEVGAIGMLPDPVDPALGPPQLLTVGFRPGVTDTVGATVKRAAEDRLGRALVGQAYSSTMICVWGMSADALQQAARALLFNPLIQRARLDTVPRVPDLEIPRAGGEVPPRIATVPLVDADDAELARISERGVLALDVHEMRAIASHFRALGRDPTDAELECIAQTWSEHCKHKIFASPIDATLEGGRTCAIERGLFRTFVRGATETIAADRRARGIDPAGAEFLVSVFHDNAGVVRFSAVDHLVYKVETHNSPSALDPYGGAMTGIVGVNRDSFGTGLGADLLANVWGYCFADPRWDGPIPPGLMHPRRIRDGVHHGVIDGGNQSGIPYMRGWELFDARYLGKPLVFCGTVAVMPVETAGRPTHVKVARPGDHVVLVGGRTGKDGIHGATFSSTALDENAPVQAVQIGDPITQKMMFDMLTVARDRGLVSSITDNGAGGLSSSVGEMAQATGGARIDLARAPLKYPGLMPWEILISEAQERMTVAVRPADLAAFLALARAYEVEATVLGEFTSDGRLRVVHGERSVADLDLEFLHDGVPLPRLTARLEPVVRDEVAAADWAATIDDARVGERLLDLLGTPELASAADRARSYDHEVKGLSVVKPLVGVRRDVPSAAAVMRARHGRNEGVVLGEGVHPFYSDLDAHAMAQACVDEGVRRVLCAGARIDRIAALDNFCWPDPVQSARTPDGAHKLAQLVRCCEGLYEACVAFGVPLVSGKDSMKNDAWLGGVKISIPPTLLVSVMGQIDDVARSLDLVAPQGSDLWLLGPTREELGGSAVLRRAGLVRTGDVPRTDPAAHMLRYRAFAAARDEGLVQAAHVVARGGLAVALAQMVLASEGAFAITLDEVAPPLSTFAIAFAETTGRIV
ncbi:MAG TPA: AIR synthase-related protein, partial [Nannocystaceae bacterium]|nr:AIR synthase-related protein [Nannocystaceae bacterium]